MRPTAIAKKKAELISKLELESASVTEKEIRPPVQKLAARQQKTRSFMAFAELPLMTCPRKVPMSEVMPEK